MSELSAPDFRDSHARAPRRRSSLDTLADLLAPLDIRLDGDRPWDIRVHDPRMAEETLSRGSLGLGESYMDGLWDCERIDELIHRILRARLDEHVEVGTGQLLHLLRYRLFNLQNLKRAWHVGESHYDLGNAFYASWLDPRMAYTCGYWAEADDLAAAQEAKLDLICRKLDLQPGQRILDIGCGWGSFMIYAAEHYGVEAVGVTISKEQARLGQEKAGDLPVEFRLQDYRSLDETFDHIVSIGMFEHVGHKNFAEYFRVARRCLKDDGLFLLHTIGSSHRKNLPDPWIDRYIFPNGDLPAMTQITEACEDHFLIEDVHNFGADYDRTLMAWNENFEAAWKMGTVPFSGADERFRRMWRYYLLSCAGAFRARRIQLWQLVLSPHGVEGGYRRTGV